MMPMRLRSGARRAWRWLWVPATPTAHVTRTYECLVCGRGVEIVGTGDFYPTAASASEVASLCRRQNGTTHAAHVTGIASPLPNSERGTP